MRALHIGGHVGVGVQREAGVGVPKDAGQGLGIHAARQRVGGEGVAQHVWAVLTLHSCRSQLSLYGAFNLIATHFAHLCLALGGAFRC